MTREPPFDRRPYVDFGHVEPKHAEIDQRLINWARWYRDRPGRFQSPMFRMYRSTDAHQQYGSDVPAPIDGADAARMQVAVVALPEPHRIALAWCYIQRDNPRKAAQRLGHSLDGLAKLIRDARTMLVNRGL